MNQLQTMNESAQEAAMNRPAAALSYALITPARNEAALIEQTIQSVVTQTVAPVKWVIVSDGSTDRTDEIVQSYAERYGWIELVRLPPRQQRHFAAKINAFHAGYAQLKGIAYDVIGNLDADITFDPEYFAFLLAKFAENQNLGVAGTPFREESGQYDYRFTSIEHVSGACQLFRRECYEAIGGYRAIQMGGVDLVAVISARMAGWQTRTFTEKTCFHHRKIGTGSVQNPVKVAFKGGRGDYMLGGHPVWEACRCVYQLTKKPLLIAGSMRLLGFAWAMATRTEKCVPPELVQFRRREQMQRLKKFVLRRS